MRYCVDCGILLKGHGNPKRCRSCASIENMSRPEARNELSIARTGMHFSQDTKTRISEASKRNWENPITRSKCVNAKLGGCLTAEHKAKIGEASRRLCQDSAYIDKVSAGVKAAWARGCYDNTSLFPALGPSSLEVMLAQALDRADVAYVQQYRPDGYWRYYDFYLPNDNLLVEVDGTYWHSLPGQKIKDREKDLVAVALGFDMLRVDECDIKVMGSDEVVRRWIL